MGDIFLFPELWNLVIRSLPTKSYSKVPLVCKSWNKVVQDELWERESKRLYVRGRRLIKLPIFFPEDHYCRGQKIDYSRIEYLNCSGNQLMTLPALPECRELVCSLNRLTTLPALPNCKILWCFGNRLTSLPALPKCEHLDCFWNHLTFLPDLPDNCIVQSSKIVL